MFEDFAAHARERDGPVVDTEVVVPFLENGCDVGIQPVSSAPGA